LTVIIRYQQRQSGLKTGGSWIRVKKFRFFSGNFTKIIDFSGEISEKNQFFQVILQKISTFQGKFPKNFDFFQAI